jgi:hypothetical protein
MTTHPFTSGELFFVNDLERDLEDEGTTCSWNNGLQPGSNAT